MGETNKFQLIWSYVEPGIIHIRMLSELNDLVFITTLGVNSHTKPRSVEMNSSSLAVAAFIKVIL